MREANARTWEGRGMRRSEHHRPDSEPFDCKARGVVCGPVVPIRSGPTVPKRPRRARGIHFFLGGIMGGRTPKRNH